MCGMCRHVVCGRGICGVCSSPTLGMHSCNNCGEKPSVSRWYPSADEDDASKLEEIWNRDQESESVLAVMAAAYRCVKENRWLVVLVLVMMLPHVMTYNPLGVLSILLGGTVRNHTHILVVVLAYMPRSLSTKARRAIATAPSQFTLRPQYAYRAAKD